MRGVLDQQLQVQERTVAELLEKCGASPVAAEAKDLLRPAAVRLRAEPLAGKTETCLLYTSPSPRDGLLSRMPSSA